MHFNAGHIALHMGFHRRAETFQNKDLNLHFNGKEVVWKMKMVKWNEEDDEV